MLHYYFTIKNNTLSKNDKTSYAYFNDEVARQKLIKLRSIIWQDKTIKLNVELAPDYTDQSEELKKTIGILTSSFENDFDDLNYVENLIKEVEEVMEGKRQITGWSAMDNIYQIGIEKEKTECSDMDFTGYIPTSEIYQLLKDWLEFLKEYYKRSFVPLEWIKEEYLEEAKKLQKPING